MPKVDVSVVEARQVVLGHGFELDILGASLQEELGRLEHPDAIDQLELEKLFLAARMVSTLTVELSDCLTKFLQKVPVKYRQKVLKK